MVGAVLLGVPAAFTVFAPELTTIGVAWRLAVAVVWVVVVVTAVQSATIRERRMDSVAQVLAEDRSSLRYLLRTGAFGVTLRAVLDPKVHGIPDTFEFTVYLHDPSDNLLRPVYPAWQGGGIDLRVFEPGKGATGTAWEQSDLVLVKGNAVSDTKYGLTIAQQAYWGPYRRAVSYPLYEDLSKKMGVLTALSRAEEDFFDAFAGQALMKELANVVSVILLTIPPTEISP